MKFVLTGGGTAGHINPALALAEILQECDHEVFFAGTPQGVEARLVGQTDIPFVAFEASGFDRERPHTLVTSSLKILRSARKARHGCAKFDPMPLLALGICVHSGGHGGRAAERAGGCA